MQKKSEGRFWVYDSSINVSFDGPVFLPLEKSAKAVFRDVIKFLGEHGFHVGTDMKVAKNYPTLADSHVRGGYERHEAGSQLEFKMNVSGRAVHLEFFQNVVFSNPNGGEYDFSRVAKMPYLVRKRFDWIVAKLVEMFIGRGLRNDTEIPASDPLGHFNQSWTAGRFKRGADGWPDDSELAYWPRLDKSGRTVQQGDRYYVSLNGRAYACRVYGGINGMWLAYFGRGNHELGAYNVERLESEPWRGRRFADWYRLRSLARDYRKAIEAHDWRKAERIKQHCDRSGVNAKELVSR